MSTQHDAVSAVWDAIEASAKRIEGAGINERARAAAIRDLAAAARHMVGGPQPGGSSIEG